MIDFSSFLESALLWGLPVLLAITLHEAAHGYIALKFGDPTAYILGRVTLNPFKHIDPIGTLLLPGMLILAHAPFVFGYAKPVPVNFLRLRPQRLGMICVALAGPLMNIFLAIVSIYLFYMLPFAPENLADSLQQILVNSIIINCVLAIFNMIPVPPLDGGRVLVGILPSPLSRIVARIEPLGMMIIFLMIASPFLSKMTVGHEISILSWILSPTLSALLHFLAHLSGVPFLNL